MLSRTNAFAVRNTTAGYLHGDLSREAIYHFASAGVKVQNKQWIADGNSFNHLSDPSEDFIADGYMNRAHGHEFHSLQLPLQMRQSEQAAIDVAIAAARGKDGILPFPDDIYRVILAFLIAAPFTLYIGPEMHGESIMNEIPVIYSVGDFWRCLRPQMTKLLTASPDDLTIQPFGDEFLVFLKPEIITKIMSPFIHSEGNGISSYIVWSLSLAVRASEIEEYDEIPAGKLCGKHLRKSSTQTAYVIAICREWTDFSGLTQADSGIAYNGIVIDEWCGRINNGTGGIRAGGTLYVGDAGVKSHDEQLKYIMKARDEEKVQIHCCPLLTEQGEGMTHRDVMRMRAHTQVNFINIHPHGAAERNIMDRMHTTFADDYDELWRASPGMIHLDTNCECKTKHFADDCVTWMTSLKTCLELYDNTLIHYSNGYGLSTAILSRAQWGNFVAWYKEYRKGIYVASADADSEQHRKFADDELDEDDCIEDWNILTDANCAYNGITNVGLGSMGWDETVLVKFDETPHWEFYPPTFFSHYITLTGNVGQHFPELLRGSQTQDYYQQVYDPDYADFATPQSSTRSVATVSAPDLVPVIATTDASSSNATVGSKRPLISREEPPTKRRKVSDANEHAGDTDFGDKDFDELNDGNYAEEQFGENYHENDVDGSIDLEGFAPVNPNGNDYVEDEDINVKCQ